MTDVSPDTEEFAFSERGPWVIDPDRLRWKAGVAELRAQTQREIPGLVQRSTLPPLGRFFESATRLGCALIAWRLKEGQRSDSVSRSGLSRRLRNAFEHLGPAYIKLAQILSSGKGLFPDELVAEFKQLRDQVRPEPFAAVRQVVEEDFGKSLNEVFCSFDTECLASASIAQVHVARLHTGEEVVVKVQR
ncbi:MAG TPA: AarF/UbiB family protein, partial [Candidatus Acidoferrales bacterium]|nr:AarF/UbiB family protein [Candidatus Acidoferrales bacterium]